ncbi:MAG: hypothetical protein J6C59_09545 [Muribaculaceae bacterium]|nr:hypothetical protein [Muribaculaceae bacterium]
MNEPKVISESKVKFSDDTEITVCLLDDGRRIIPETDMLKALKFLGFNESEINRIMTDKLNKT